MTQKTRATPLPPSHTISRRQIIGWGATTLWPLGMSFGKTDQNIAENPAEWEAALDALMHSYMEPRRVPGGSLAIAKHGRLVFAKGYGWADLEKQEPVHNGTRFRIASISKPLTALAILKLVETEKLQLDEAMLDFFPGPFLHKMGEEMDPRMRQITVRHLLHHTAGWDRAVSGDPMFQSIQIAKKTGTPTPASIPAIIQYVLGQALDFAPGERYAYSNFGYCLLGQIIAQRSGMPYAEYVQSAILRPCDARHLTLGASKESDRAENESRYYMPQGDNTPTRSVFPGPPDQVPWPYGGFCLETMDAHGGWIASATDLVRLTSALDPKAAHPLFQERIRTVMLTPPPAPISRQDDGSLRDHYYACGWAVSSKNGEIQNFSHNGSLPGTWTTLTHRSDGYSWAALFNQRSSDPKFNDSEIDALINHWLDEHPDSPDINLFSPPPEK